MKTKPAIILTVFFLTANCLVGISALMAEEAPSPYQLAQQAADDAYDNGTYATAYKKYLKLARRGDTFSQYRLSYMHFQGQSVDVDWAEAFAWAAGETVAGCAAATSRSITRPFGPLPATVVISTPLFSARFFALGEAAPLKLET